MRKSEEKKLNVQHSTPNAQRRIKEILNKEKEMTNDEKSVKEHLSEIQKGGTPATQLHYYTSNGAIHRTLLNYGGNLSLIYRRAQWA